MQLRSPDQLYGNTVELRLKASLIIRNQGALTRSPVPGCFGFFEQNFDTGFFTTLGLFRRSPAKFFALQLATKR
ncbi:hypothetical protein NIES4073_37490 [Kalymmatonema gypsitolerans NIES-4073]|nr:hypothetical protein NIES4073_37490 [Scytonema sp. NIES-4073]